MITISKVNLSLRMGEGFPLWIRSKLQRIRTNLRFRFFLPAARRATLGGVRLSLKGMSPMMKNIILTGRYEREERRLCDRSLEREDVVLQLGSAIGFLGLYCLKTIGVKRVYEVEANPDTLEKLKVNYRKNGEVARVLHAAVAPENGNLELNVGGEFWENSLVSSGSESISVPARTLSSILNEFGGPSISAVICDIEGAEEMLDFGELPDSVRTIIIELHPEIIGERPVSRIEAAFVALGFREVAREFNTRLYQRGAG